MRSPARLYVLELSHPAHTARLALEHKGIAHRRIVFPVGLHAPGLRFAGFPGVTVPALEIDGRRIQGSLEITRVLEQIRPEPPLYPTDPEHRRAVQEAEIWGERILQPVPRRILRRTLTRSAALRRFLAASAGMPAPGVAQIAVVPLGHAFSRQADATVERVQADLRELDGLIAHVDRLLAAGTIGGEQANAADLQIATSLRLLLAFPELRRRIEGRPADDLARRYLPEYPDFPAAIPLEWLPA